MRYITVQKIHPKIIYSKIPAPMQTPATLSTATVSPCLAILVSREALPLRFVPKEEKTSFCKGSVVSRTFKRVILALLEHYLRIGGVMVDVPYGRGCLDPAHCRGC